VADPDFELLGTSTDETRLLVHKGAGYSIPIPGHPVVATAPAGSPAYGAIVRMADVPIEHGFRLDDLPTSTEPAGLAQALATAYANARAETPPPVRAVPPKLRADGAAAAASALYVLRDAADRSMEHLVVTIKPRNAAAVWALYHTARYTIREVNPIRWAHVRTAIADKQHWDPAAPRRTTPALWPATSAFAECSAALKLTESAWAEASAKAAAIGPLADDETEALAKLILGMANNDDPPTLALHPYILELAMRQIAMQGPTRAAEAILRNLAEVKTTHDLRAWCWQCVWAIGNRDDRDPSQRTTN
jgi:hypothetical protein